MGRNLNNEKEMKGFLKGKLRSVKSLHAFYYFVLTIKIFIITRLQEIIKESKEGTELKKAINPHVGEYNPFKNIII